MKYRKLGSTNLKVSVIGIGTWQFGGEWGIDFTQPEVDAILDEASQRGINLIDTAECYGDHLSEKFIGNYLKRRNRGEWIVATKFGHHYHDRFTRDPLYSPTDMLKQLDASLQALQIDCIDLYQFHSGSDEVFDNDELWTMLDKQKQAGKIKHIGTSVAQNTNIHQVSQSARNGAEVIQIVYNRLERDPETTVFASCQEQNLGVLARVPLASGYLSGKYKPGQTFSSHDTRHRHDAEIQKQKLEEALKIKENEVPHNMDMATWALAWCLKHDAVTSVIPGCKNVAQVISNANAANYVPDNHPSAWVE